MEDATHALLQDVVESLSNLPSEITHLLSEVSHLDHRHNSTNLIEPPVFQNGNNEPGQDKRWYAVEELKKKAAAKHSSIVRYSHKAPNTLLTPNPKESLLVERTKVHYSDALILCDEKERLIAKAQDLVSRHLNKLNSELSKLEMTTGVEIPDFRRDLESPATGSFLDAQQAQTHLAQQPPPSSSVSALGAAGAIGTPGPGYDAARRRKNPTSTPTPLSFRPANLADLPPSHHPHATDLTANSVYAHPHVAASHHHPPPHHHSGPAHTSGRQRSRLSESVLPSRKRRKTGGGGGGGGRRRDEEDEDEDEDEEDEEDDAYGEEEEEGVVADEGGDEGTLYCFCQRVSFGEMIGCDGPKCMHEWFHLQCVGLKATPTGSWFCPDCREENKKKGISAPRANRRGRP